MGLFGSIFKKEPLFSDFSFIEADIHSHIIPGLDDGAESMETALEMARHFCKLGYKRIITTPHIYSGKYLNTPDTIFSGLKSLQDSLKNVSIDIKVSAAAEYFLDYAFFELLKSEKLLTFGKQYLLIELPVSSPLINLHQIIFEIQLAGYLPVLAHAERYLYWNDHFQEFRNLKDRDVLFQLNLSSLLPDSPVYTRKLAHLLIKNNMYDFVGSDAHDVQGILRLKGVLDNPHFLKLVTSGHIKNPSV